MTEAEFHSDYLSLSPGLYRIAYHILESQAEAEDAVQDLYLKLWKMRDSLDSVRNPMAYCSLILRNICIDRIRSSRKEVVPAILPETEAEQPQDERIDSRQRLEKVLAAVKSLPERQRQILTLKLVEGKTFDQISQITKLNYLTIRVMLSRARKSLKNRI